VKKISTNKRIRLALRGQTIRELRDLAEQELLLAHGAVACDALVSSATEAVCSTPH